MLSSSAIQALLEGAMRRHPSRLAALARLLAAAPGIQFAGAPSITEDEIAAEVEAVRAARRAR